MWYFVTLCTAGRKCVLGDVMQDAIRLSPIGEIAARTWLWLPQQFPRVHLGGWILMPNHLHGIIGLADDAGGSRAAPTVNATSVHKPLTQIIGAFKTRSTKEINALSKSPGEQFWQRSFYDHIVRDEQDLARIREYIRTNPQKWSLDEENPANWQSQRRLLTRNLRSLRALIPLRARLFRQLAAKE